MCVIDTASLLNELEPEVGRLLERHLSSSKEWFPHELIPFGRAQDFEAGGSWSPEHADLGEVTLCDAARSSLFVNLLTEDNLPYYFHQIDHMFGANDAWGEWSRRWTAEEGRHSMVIYGYLMATRAIDPWELERARMHQVAGGRVPRPGSPVIGMAYVAMQELATRLSHRNTGVLLDPTGYEVMKRVASDENRHHLFYRDMVSAALAIDPSSVVCAIRDAVVGFEMPGAGIPDFKKHAHAIAKIGVYDLAVHYDQVLVPCVLRAWGLETLTDLTAEGEQAREQVLAYLAKSERVARRLESSRERAQATESV